MAGVLRIHFADLDFRRVQLMKSPDPMWEAVLALHVLSTPVSALPERLQAWRTCARRQLADSELRSACGMLNALAPADASYFPDFLTPLEAADGMESGLEALRSTPGHRMARELKYAARRRTLPAWTHRLAAGDRGTLEDLAGAVQRFHTRLIRPDWSQVEATVEVDRVHMLNALEEGVGALLGAIRPFTWSDPVLSAPYPMDHSIHLQGRGLRLIPSFFCHTNPVAIVDPNLPPVVVYPVNHHTSPVSPQHHSDALEDLLGRNRARVLMALKTTHTTGGLAARLAVSGAAVSVHVKILRSAGLVDSRRVGSRIVHILTPRGQQLLDC
ncbi:ArsR/SmtB family transcription factor [Streptomyces sp. NPDC057575]|uniref:ArsR/SmtB family transcription factor n=1 Tax=unclassified Streptomyces TaxID=2593676 RepID=UPI00369D69EC